MQFDTLYNNILEALQGVDPRRVDDLISNSFKDVVVSDLLAQASIQETPSDTIDNQTSKGILIDSTVVVDHLKNNIPQLFEDYNVTFDIDESYNRVALDFDELGAPTIIRMPTKVNKDLGPVIVLHELSHVMYSIDIITNDMLDHPHSAQAFTLARTLEDVRTEQLMEQEYPQTAAIFKSRAQYIVPLYKKHTPTSFSSIVDHLFLYLRGYSKTFKYDNSLLTLAQRFIDAGNSRKQKVDAILTLVDAILT
jgi:hypothetical protein